MDCTIDESRSYAAPLMYAQAQRGDDSPEIPCNLTNPMWNVTRSVIHHSSHNHRMHPATCIDFDRILCTIHFQQIGARAGISHQLARILCTQLFATNRCASRNTAYLAETHVGEKSKCLEFIIARSLGRMHSAQQTKLNPANMYIVQAYLALLAAAPHGATALAQTHTAHHNGQQ